MQGLVWLRSAGDADDAVRGMARSEGLAGSQLVRHYAPAGTCLRGVMGVCGDADEGMVATTVHVVRCVTIVVERRAGEVVAASPTVVCTCNAAAPEFFIFFSFFFFSRLPYNRIRPNILAASCKLRIQTVIPITESQCCA